MFDIGFWELSIIGVVALLVVGPERLPELARTLGRWIGQARRLAYSVRNEIESEFELSELRRLRREMERTSFDDLMREEEPSRSSGSAERSPGAGASETDEQRQS